MVIKNSVCQIVHTVMIGTKLDNLQRVGRAICLHSLNTFVKKPKTA